jgi:hypothetical protein
VWAWLKHKSPTAVFNISKVYAPFFPSITQNLMHTCCSFSPHSEHGQKCDKAHVHALVWPKLDRHCPLILGRPLRHGERRLKATFQQRGTSQLLLPVELQNQSRSLLITPYIALYLKMSIFSM